MKRFHSGYVSLTGKPNVGKSTLLNTILGKKVAIVTPKAQTTRNRIVGIKNLPGAQLIFLDTPGIHRPKHTLGEMMVKEAKESVKEVDLILFMVEPEKPGDEDLFILNTLKGLKKPVFLLINKVDQIKKPELLPIIEAYSREYSFNEIFPISALKEDGIDAQLKKIVEYMPEGPQYYPPDLVTDQTERFMVAEIIREKIMLRTQEEVPHSIAVEVAEWTERENGAVYIRASILVEREGQKSIIIGKSGTLLKAIGTSARRDIEDLLGTKVFLELWVKVKKEWRRDVRILRELGFK